MKSTDNARSARRYNIRGLSQQTARCLTWFWPAAGRAMVNTLLPPRCQACGRAIAGPDDAGGPVERKTHRGTPGAADILRRHLCNTCADLYIAIQSPHCTCCGKMFAGRGPDHLCGECTRKPWYFRRARSAGVFDQSLAALIHRFKYSGRTGLAQPLGRLMLAVLAENWQPAEIDRIVPIPLHPKRMHNRGFNQSTLLVRTWATRADTGDGAWAGIPVETDLINRTRPTATQTGLGRKDRIANLKGAFRCGWPLAGE